MTWKKCANHVNPDKACGSDADCIPTNLCVSTTSKCVDARVASPPPGSYADFSGRSCGTHADCVPDGPLCQPITLKVDVEAGNGFLIKQAWDLVTDPDQAQDRYDEASQDPYLKLALKHELEDCMRGYWKLEGNDNWRTGDEGDCPWPIGN
jgi:hypothetical protein